MKPISYKSNGKLLLTGEYVVLDGALALALPTKFGQTLTIESIDEQKLIWKSLDNKGSIWFEDKFSLSNGQITSSHVTKNDVSKRLIDILNEARQLNSEFLKDENGYKVTSILEFPNNWGLGSSSTLLNNIAQWAKIDAFALSNATFGGSGYDIACAQINTAITYQLKKPFDCAQGDKIIKEVAFNPSFKEALYFVHLNKKQNSRDGIAQYKTNTLDKTEVINKINTITSALINCDNLTDFNKLLETHETLISSIIKQTPVKEKLFPDFNGSIKSLGAWGGDFVLATSTENPTGYFKNKGYKTIIPYSEMIK